MGQPMLAPLRAGGLRDPRWKAKYQTRLLSHLSPASVLTPVGNSLNLGRTRVEVLKAS